MNRLLFYVFLLIAILGGVYAMPTRAPTPTDYKSILPLKLEADGLIASGNDGSLFDILGFRREFCGAAVLKLARQTSTMIEHEGLRFFDGVTESRGFKGNPYYHFSAWQPTPVPSSWFGDGNLSASLNCAEIDQKLRRRVRDASLMPGSFYATKDRGELIILPREGMAVFTYLE